MNRIHRVVWSSVRQVWVVASEWARGQRKSNSSAACARAGKVEWTREVLIGRVPGFHMNRIHRLVFIVPSGICHAVCELACRSHGAVETLKAPRHVAVVALVIMAGWSPAWANGGRGEGAGSLQGGAGGTTASPDGGNGANASPPFTGGGGGGGSVYLSGPNIGAGGRGGNSGSSNGNIAAGGAGGAAGHFALPDETISASFQGTDGVAGSATGGSISSGGGGGGGAGAVGTSVDLTSSGSLLGGNGGQGGNNVVGGGGGEGGVGFIANGANVLLLNAGTITGGTGGAGANGGAGGSNGSGGIGVAGGSNFTIVNSGQITGGLSANGLDQANAIQFSGTNNTLVLRSGSVISGNVVAVQGGTDTLGLGGTGASSFDTSTIGTTRQYRNFRDFQKTGSSTFTLTGNPGQVTPWSILGGTLAISSDANLGGASSPLTFAGGTLQFTSSINTSRVATINTVGTIDTAGNNVTFANTIRSLGRLIKQGLGTLTLTGSNTYSGGTTIASGTLQIGEGGTRGAIRGDILNNAALIVNRSNTVNSSGVISGIGTLVQTGSGLLNLLGVNTYTGLTTANAGVLAVNGVVAGGAQVNAGATLRGTGTVAGDVVIADTGRLAPGNSTGTFNLGSLLLSGNSQLDYELGLPDIIGAGVNDLTTVAGDLTLDGTLNLSNVGGMSQGIYRLFNYTGTLTNNGLDIVGVLPPLFGPANFVVDVGTTGQVNLIVLAGGAALNYWDGANTTANNIVDGGSGTWNNTIASWTGVGGAVSSAWQSGFAVFQGSAGTVTLGEDINFDGMQFRTDGYTIESGGFSLAGGALSIIRVDPLITATINAPIIDGVGGPTRLLSSGGGLLVLNGANTYSGGTGINGGAVQVGADTNLGAASGGIILNNGALFTSASFTSGRTVGLGIDGGLFVPQTGTTLTLTGTIAGPGTLNKAGAGTLVLEGINSYSGGTALGSGVVAVSSDTNLGDSGGELIFDGGTLRLDADMDLAATRVITLNTSGGSIDTNGHTSTVAQTMAGNGALTKLGNGTLVLSGQNVYTGGTTISAGTLQVGNGGASGSLLGNITNNAALVFDRSDEFSYDGIISGPGTVALTGPGIMAFSADQTYTGGTTINTGTLQLGTGGASGGVLGNIANNGALVFDRSDLYHYDGVVSGSGSLTQSGTGTVVFIADQTYTGGTTIENGILRLGNGGTSGSVVGDIVNNGTLELNRSDDVLLSNLISGSGSVTQAGSGSTTFQGPQTYTGPTTVTAGTLKAGAPEVFSPVSTYIVSPGATLDTAGYPQHLAGLTNAGTVSLSGTTPGNTLTVTGPYVGNQGVLRLGTALGDNGSVSDRLVLDGAGASASGTTSVQITNLAGLGAQTSGNGIEVITAQNGATTTAQSSQDAFVLGGGGHVDAGAFEYRLYPADADGAGENWYLRSESKAATITYRGDVPLFVALAAQLRQADLAMLGNLHRRIGDEARPAMDPAGDTPRVWARWVYADLDIKQPGEIDAQSDGHMSGLQIGVDLLARDNWRAGFYVGNLDGRASVTGNAHGTIAQVGRDSVQSRYVGAYTTWLDDSGLYVDGVLQSGDHHYTVRSDSNPNVSDKAGTFTASLEVGKAFDLSGGWSIEPQAQLIYQETDLEHVGLTGAQVHQEAEAGWITRLGVRTKVDLQTEVGKLQPYTRLNLYHANSGNDVTTFIGSAGATPFSSPSGYSSAEVAAGATLELTKDLNLYGEVGSLWDVGGDAAIKSSVAGTLGVKMRW